MELRGRAAGNTAAPDSRRSRREALVISVPSSSSHAPKRGPKRSQPGASRWVARTAVLASLALATIVVPLGAGSSTFASTPVVTLAEVPVAPVDAKSTFDVLTSGRSADATSIIVADDSVLAERNLGIASRSNERDDVATCVPRSITSGNGLLTSAEWCARWTAGHSLQADAAVSFIALNDAFRVRFGTDMCLTDSYRTLGSQRSVAIRKPGLAASPGKSMHGWGLAVDICSGTYVPSAQWNWLKVNGPIFGWDNPAWARRGGSGAYEPWHWEYFPIVETIVW